MITQEYKQGKHTIKIEQAVSLEDAKNNGFHSGTFTRYYVDGKITENYMAMIRFIVEEAKKNNSSLIPPNEKELREKRAKMFAQQKEDMMAHVRQLKETYGDSIPEDTLKQIDDYVDKLNITGMRDTR